MLLPQTLTLRAAFTSSMYLLPQRGGQNRLFCLRRCIHVCNYGLSAHVRLFLNCHGADRGFLPPSLDSRVQIRPFCLRRPSLILTRTAARTVARARSAQGSSQFAAGYAAVRCAASPDSSCSHKSLRKRIRDYVLTGLLLFGKTEQPEIHAAGESVDS